MGATNTYTLRSGFTFGHKIVPIIDAVEKGNFERVKSMLAVGGDPNARQTLFPVRWCFLPFTMSVDAAHAKTILMLAAAAGNKELVLLLLNNRAEIDAMNATGWTALGSAIEQGHIKVVKLLINRGADVNTRSPFDGRGPLSLAAVEPRADIVKLLLESGADVNAIDDAGYTALMEPAGSGYKDVVEILLTAGIDVNVRNNEGFTALQYAKENNQTEIVDLLVRAGAYE